MAYFWWVVRPGPVVDAVDGTQVTTRYWSAFGLVPMVVVDSALETKEGSHAIAPLTRAQLVAYLRTWWLMALPLVAAFHDFPPALALLGAGCLGMVVTSFVLAQPSARERRRRAAFARVLATSADPKLVAELRPKLRAHLAAEVDRRSPPDAGQTYREAAPSTWYERLLRTNDVELLLLGATLARIDGEAALEDALFSSIGDRALPERVEILAPEPELATGARAPVPNVPRPAEVPALPTHRGSLIEKGYRVELPQAAYDPGGDCASCGAPAQIGDLLRAHRSHVEIPCCWQCLDHAVRGRRRQQTVAMLVVLGAAVAGVLGFARPVGQPTAALASALLGGWLAFLVVRALPPARAATAADLSTHVARTLRAPAGRLALFTTSSAFAATLVERSGARRRATRRLAALVPVTIVCASTGALVAGLVAWEFGHPRVHVDNGFGDFVQIWVDHRPALAAHPSGAGEGASLRLSHGPHTIGYGPIGASSPTEEISITVAIGGKHLYDPGARNCYYYDIAAYGGGERHEAPPRVQSFHTVPKVDVWFADNPPQGKVGTESIALRRIGACRALCSTSVRQRLLDCLDAARSEDGAQACLAVARESCPMN